MTQPTGPATDGAAQGGGEYCSERGNEASLFNRLYFQVFQVFQYLITIPTMQVLQTRCYNAGVTTGLLIHPVIIDPLTNILVNEKEMKKEAIQYYI